MRVARAAATILAWGTAVLPAAGQPSDDASLRAHAIYLAQKAQFESHPIDPAAAWKFGRACFDWADFSSTPQRRAEIANEGIDACRKSAALKPNLAPAHYYWALNLGQLARTRGLSALHLIREMETELKTAAALDGKFDYAGPDRSLGMLYLQAPGWPISIGSKKKAVAALRQTVGLSPNFPKNRLELLDALVKSHDRAGAEREEKALEELWPKARREFSGAQWAASWDSWERQWQRLQKKLAR